MSAEGWVKLYRKVQDNPLWTSEQFSRGQAWVDLILLANHKDSFYYLRGVKINVQRGQIARSERTLSERWQWSRTKVRKFLNDLEKELQIGQQKNNVVQLLTILKYDEYQEKEPQTRPQKNHRRTTERPIQECKEGKEYKETTTEQPKSGYSSTFETFWNEYPRKKGKAKAYSYWKKHKCDNGLFKTIMESLEAQKQSKEWARDNGQYIPHGVTWVTGRRWEDETEKQSEWE